MKHLLFIICGSVILAMGCSRKNLTSAAKNMVDNSISTDTTLAKIEYIFPDDWLGNWQGDLKIHNVNGLKQTLPMELDLSETDVPGIYTWAITYGEDSIAHKRDYVLKEIDSNKGHYVIDEKNGILIDAYHIHDELSSIFGVMGNTLVNSYRREGDELIFSIKIFPSKEIRVSGDTIMENQKIPEVASFQHTISQIGRLQKKCLVE